jgi:hypothetical protein
MLWLLFNADLEGATTAPRSSGGSPVWKYRAPIKQFSSTQDRIVPYGTAAQARKKVPGLCVHCNDPRVARRIPLRLDPPVKR